MKIGLMADTHDRLEMIEKAVNFFNGARVDHVFHAGDIISPFTAEKFKPLKAKIYMVWGNNDGDRELLRSRFEKLGAQILGDLGALEFENRKIALLHGTNQAIVDSLVKSQLYDVVVRAHTHHAEIVDGEKLVINPGEVCGYLTGNKTVALLDLTKLRAEIVEL